MKKSVLIIVLSYILMSCATKKAPQPYSELDRFAGNWKSIDSSFELDIRVEGEGLIIDDSINTVVTNDSFTTATISINADSGTLTNDTLHYCRKRDVISNCYYLIRSEQ